MKKLFLIIGAPGSGKTTDAELIAQKNENITHYSTGDMLRDEVASGSDKGKELDSYMSKGEIVPIAIVVDTILSAIKSSSTEGIIIDGYPRSVEQTNALDAYLANEESVTLVNVIEIQVSEKTARDRVLGRARGTDDKTEVFDNRMRVYTEPLDFIRGFYIPKGILHTISGEGSIDSIVNELDGFIQSKI